MDNVQSGIRFDKKVAVTAEKKYKRHNISLKNILIYLILPLIPLLVFWFIPMIVSFMLSFTDWDYISPSYNVVGMENYIDILADGMFWQAFKNTIFFGLGTVIPTLILGFLMAMLLQKKIMGKPFFQGFLFSPWITPMVAMSIVWSWMFRPNIGLINKLLSYIGITGPNWLTDSKTALLAVIIVTVWKNAGWAMLYYSDALSKIPESLYEVGDLEGATVFQQIRHILVPLTKNTTFFLGIVSLIDSIQAYDQINVLTGGGPAGSTRTLLYLFYQTAFEEFNMRKATSIAMIIVIITSLLALIMVYSKKKLEH